MLHNSCSESRPFRETPELLEILEIIENPDILQNFENSKNSTDVSKFLLWI